MTIPTPLVRSALNLTLVAAVLSAPVSAQEPCPARANAIAEAGWEALRTGSVDAAGTRFEEGLALCGGHLSSRIGRGYVALRRNELESATADFRAALERSERTAVDAHVGLGLVAWRRGDLPEVQRRFTRVLELEPGHALARKYLDRIRAGVGAPPARPPFVRPEELVYPARVREGGFEVRGGSGWERFYIRGVNLGAATPGHHPSEFPDSATYAGWLRGMSAMGANVIRLYTIHPPHFYGALKAHNEENPASPLWLIHGVWTELPPGDDFRDPAWEGGFFEEMERVVDLLHGRADIPPRPGHASGFYTRDVSAWVLAYIIGREWEPYAVVSYNQMRSDEVGFDGRYLGIRGGTPADAWMARAMEHMVAHETETYNAQRPIAYTNWPTLDPLRHVTESTVAEEVAVRRRLGERVETVPREYDNDAASLDAALITATRAFPAGHFASYHAYPYYPDFMILDPAYNEANSPFGRSNYFGYLHALKEHHGEMAVVIAEYGVPASLGSAHIQPQGWHHGGLSEAAMARINARMTREISAAGMAGGVLFAWIDEWFKKNWLTIPFEIPLERNRLWYNRLDAEQHYGVIAYDAVPAVSGATLSERVEVWRDLPPLYDTDAGRVWAAADAAYLWLLVEPEEPAGRIVLGVDVVLPGAGDRRLPDVPGPFDVGVEFAMIVEGDSARLLVDPPYNPFRIRAADAAERHSVVAPPPIEDPPPGLFLGRLEQGFGRPIRPVDNEDGYFEELRVVTNRRRFSRDGVEFLALGYDRGLLPPGPPPDGLWERGAGGAIEVRIPWALLNVTDPSQRRVLLDHGDDEEFGTVTVPDIGVVGAYRAPGGWRYWPAAGQPAARFGWPVWNAPAAAARERPALEAMRAVFRDLR